MATYPNRTATTGTAIELTFRKVIDIPAMPDQDGSFGMPCFLNGRHVIEGLPAISAGLRVSNRPAIWIDIYNNLAATIDGALSFGASHADYALRTIGAVNTNLGQQFDSNGYVDGALFSFEGGTLDTTEVFLEYFRQSVGDNTGGNSSDTLSGSRVSTSVFLDKNTDTFGAGIVVPSLASTTTTPEALLLFTPAYVDGQKDVCHALKMGLATGPTKISLYQTNGEQSAPFASCRSDTTHYFLRDLAGNECAFTTCVENTFLSYAGDNHYNPCFSDANLPATFADFWWGTDANFELTHVYGTDSGFLIGFKHHVASVWQPKWILVDKAWTTVQFITATAGDATATSILAQGVGSYNDDALTPVSMMAEDGVYWLLGGTSEAPLIVEASGAVVNTDTILRVWGFSLDGHDFYCLRLGGSGSIIYDLTTNQICEWASPDDTKWRAHVGQNWVGMDSATFANDFGSDVVAGDDTAGILWVLDPTAGQDDDATTGDPVSYTRKVTGELQVSGRDAMPCGAVTLDLSVGDPVDSSATITLRTSDDLGQSFRSHGAQTIEVGNFNGVVEWRGCGLIRAPGRIFQISDTGAAVRISGANLR